MYGLYDMAYCKSKDITKRTQSRKALKDKVSKIATDPKYDGYQRGLASMVYKFSDKKSSGSGVDTSLTNKSAMEPNYQFAKELQRQIIRNFKGRKVYSSFRDYIWGVDLVDIQSLSKYKKGIKYLLRPIDLLSK